MKFSPKCRTKKLGRFYSLLNWEGAVIQPQIRPSKIPEGNYGRSYFCCRPKVESVKYP